MSENFFGIWLRQARKRRGLSQKELAGLVGVSSRSITAWEGGRTSAGEAIQERLRQELSEESAIAAAYRRGYAQAVEDMKGRLAIMERGPAYHTRHGKGSG
jgi:transcriptional regulator with XRE-family HTH domain